MYVLFSLRASLRTFNPKQLKYEDKSDTKFKFSTFNKNVNRVKAATAGFDPELAIRELKLETYLYTNDNVNVSHSDRWVIINM